MLDYHAHIACLRSISNETALRLAANPDPKFNAINDAVIGNFPHAALGAVMYRLFEHAQGTSDREISVLEGGLELWTDFRKMIDQVAAVRVTLESLVLNPTQPDLVAKFNAVANGLQAQKPAFQNLTAKMQTYYADIQSIDWVKQHGLELNQPTEKWNLRDVALSSRTGALVSNILLLTRLDRTDDATAFGYGVLSAYAGNAVGSAYLNQTVGGPRRSHPLRSRLAENSVGAWYLEHQPGLTLSIPKLRSLLTFGAPQSPSLPPRIEKIIQEALKSTYSGKLGPSPNLQEAYGKLLHHLDLLGSFPMPPNPQPIDATLKSKIQSLSPQDIANTSAPPSDGAAPAPSGGSSSNDHPWGYYVAAVICAVLTALCYLVGICSNDQGLNSPKYPDPTTPDPNGVGQATSYLTSDDATAQVNLTFNMHQALYDLGRSGLTVLKNLGLLYPIGPELGAPAYAQFVTTPPTFNNPTPFTSLHRPIADANLFGAVPISAAENPTGNVYPFPTVASPLVFITGSPTTPLPNVVQYGTQLWFTEAVDSADSDIRHINRNLDADRGINHECWNIKPGTVGIDPLPVNVLNYTDI
jgi:hypothetical protein